MSYSSRVAVSTDTRNAEVPSPAAESDNHINRVNAEDTLPGASQSRAGDGASEAANDSMDDVAGSNGNTVLIRLLVSAMIDSNRLAFSRGGELGSSWRLGTV